MGTREVTAEIESSHGGFVVDGLVPASSSAPAIDDNTLVAWWPDTAADLRGFFVSGGSQWGPFAIAARVLDGDPGDPGEEWEDVVEVTVRSSGAMTLDEVVDGPVSSLDVPPGTYRMRLSARGRTESRDRALAFPDEDLVVEPGALEHFLVELWPTAMTSPAVVLRQDSAFAQEILHPSEPVWPAEREPGLRAARAIARDVRQQPGARDIRGPLGAISLDLELPGTPTRLFDRLRHTFAWPPCRGGSGTSDVPGQTAYYDATLSEPDDAYDYAGHIATTLLELDRPRRVVTGWNWVPEVDASPSRPWPLDDRPRLLATDSRVTLMITQGDRSAAEPRCAVSLQHSGIPTAWAEDLTALWTWHLVARSQL